MSVGGRAAALAAGFVAGTAAALRLLGGFRVEVAGESMAPSLRPGDFLLAVRQGSVRRGDVVVLRHPDRDLEIVKRVVALPGDRVGDRALGPDELLAVGDNAAASTDGRAFGPIRRDAVAGVVRLRYWPRPGRL